MRLAVELDPLNPFVRALHGVQLLMADDLQGAIRVTEEVLASTPGFGFGYYTLIHAYHYLGEKAIDWYELGFQITGPNVPYLGAKVKTPAIQSNPRFIKLLRDMKLDYWTDKYSQPSE